MDARSRRLPEPKPSSVLKAKAAAAEKKVEDYADDDDDSLEEEEEEEENYGGEFGISSEKCVKKKKKKVVFGGGSGKKGSCGGGGGGGGLLPPRCQAEKCDADLTDAKRYHRRHKVCELHAKAPAAIVAGLRQRFCQQCSRFHVLSEFDDTKRSCRRRLAGHNERRRKSSSESHGGEGGQTSGLQLNENHCRQADDRGIRTLVAFPGNPIYKQFHIK